MELLDLFNQVLDLVKNFASMESKAAIGAVITILLSLWKSSILRPFWDKLGAAKVLVAPVLGLVAALVAIPELNWAAIVAGVQSGMLAIAFHELLNAIKALPFVGDKYKQWIDFVDKALFRPKLPSQQ